MNLNPVSIVQRVVVWDRLIVDLYLESMMTQIGMNRVGKVKCGTAIFLIDDFTLWREYIERVRACTNIGTFQDNTSSTELVGLLIQLIPPGNSLVYLSGMVR